MAGRKVSRRRFLKEGSIASAIVSAGRASAEAGASVEEQENASQSQYAGPLAEFDLKDRQLDSLEFSRSRYERNKPSMSFTARDKRAALAWQKRARAKLIELVGGFPARRAPLRAEVLEKRQFDDYTREKIIFQSRDDLSVFGYLLLPKKYSRPGPAIICLPGHGRGADDIVGIEEDGKQRRAAGGYQKDFAVQAARHGFAAFAIEQLAFGCRRDEAARKRGAGQSSCQPAAGAALLFGQTMIGWRVWDVMRALDYLSARPEIDDGRIATMGISGGGTASLFSAAMDERIKISVVSGYFNTFRDSILSISHCMDNYVPGILNYVEMYDLAGLIAPRGLFVESGTRDKIFPIQASKRAFEEARRIYAAFGAAGQVGQEIFDDEHTFYGRGAFEFLKRWL